MLIIDFFSYFPVLCMHMKNFLKNSNEITKMVLLSVIIGILVIGCCCLSLIWHNTGWIIGAVIGTLIEVLNVALLYKGSSYALKNLKAWVFILFYFSRMFLFLIGALICILAQYIWKISAFDYSFFGILVAYTPMQIIVCVVMSKEKKNPITIGKEE